MAVTVLDVSSGGTYTTLAAAEAAIPADPADGYTLEIREAYDVNPGNTTLTFNASNSNNVTIMVTVAEGFRFTDQASWPGAGDLTAAIEAGAKFSINAANSSHGILVQTSDVCIEWLSVLQNKNLATASPIDMGQRGTVRHCVLRGTARDNSQGLEVSQVDCEIHDNLIFQVANGIFLTSTGSKIHHNSIALDDNFGGAGSRRGISSSTSGNVPAEMFGNIIDGTNILNGTFITVNQAPLSDDYNVTSEASNAFLTGANNVFGESGMFVRIGKFSSDPVWDLHIAPAKEGSYPVPDFGFPIDIDGESRDAPIAGADAVLVPTTIPSTTPAPTTAGPTTLAPTTAPPTTPAATTFTPTTQASTTPVPTTVPRTFFPPDEVPEPPIILPTACITFVSPTQVRNSMHIEWDLVWPEGAFEDPDEIRQHVERSQHPNGPFQEVGMVPGPRAFFIDVSVDFGTFTKTWYYRIKCRRVRR